MEWTPLSFEHKPLIDKTLEKNPLNLSDYTFTNLWLWNIHRHYHIALIDDFLCIKFVDNEHSFFLYPIGQGNHKLIIEKLMQAQADFRMRAVPEGGIAELKGMPLHIDPETDHFDYIYAYADLLYLEGDLFQSKRNFIHQFEKNYNYQFHEITLELIPSIIEAEKIWFDEHEDPEKSLLMEHESVLVGLKDFAKLHIYGGVLLVDQKVAAYSFAEYLNKEMLVVHIEKALKGFKGAYAMINRQMLMHLPAVPYINREEALNLDNLIKVKESYHPIRLEKKFLLTSKS